MSKTQQRPSILQIGKCDRTIDPQTNEWIYLLDGWLMASANHADIATIDKNIGRPGSTFWGWPVETLHEISHRRSEFEDHDGKPIDF